MSGWRVVFPEPQRVVLEEFEPVDPGAGEVRVKAVLSLLSTGTEMTGFTGRFAPGTHWERWVKYPFRPGYSLLGVVEEVGPEVSTPVPGDRVALRAPHSSHHVVPADRCIPVPTGTPDDEAVWFALAQIGFRGAQAADFRLGQRTAIIGAGPIGQMALRWARAAGSFPITVIDIFPLRLEKAEAGGATRTLRESIADVRIDPPPDVVVDSTGNPAVFEHALRLAADYGRVLLLGDAGLPNEQRLTSDLLRRGLTVVGAHDVHVRWDMRPPRVYELFFELVRTGRFPLSGLISHRFAPDECADAYALAGQTRGETIGIAISWEKKSPM